MGNKIGLLLSFIIFIQAMIFAGDVLMYQVAYSELIAESVVVNRQIELHQSVNEDVIKYVEERLNSSIECLSGCEGDRGDTLVYEIVKTHHPILVFLFGSTYNQIIIRRTVVLP